LSRSGFTEVVQVALLLLFVQLNPVVHARHLSVLDLAQKHMLKARRVVIGGSAIEAEPELMHHIHELSPVGRGEALVSKVPEQSVRTCVSIVHMMDDE
jgi:hypothetical protein